MKLRRLFFRILVATALLSSSGLAMATQQSGGYKGAIVVMLDVNCPACAAFFKQHRSFEVLARSAGYAVSYAPVPQSGNADHAWPERTYYAVRDFIGQKKANETLSAIFDAQKVDRTLNSFSEVQAWLGLKVFNVNWRKLGEDVVKTKVSKLPVKKAMALARQVKLQTFPAFVSIKLGKATLIPTNGDLPKKIKMVKSWLQNQHTKANSK